MHHGVRFTSNNMVCTKGVMGNMDLPKSILHMLNHCTVMASYFRGAPCNLSNDKHSTLPPRTALCTGVSPSLSCYRIQYNFMEPLQGVRSDVLYVLSTVINLLSYSNIKRCTPNFMIHFQSNKCVVSTAVTVMKNGSREQICGAREKWSGED